MVKVYLLQDVKNLGKSGSIVEVKEGYAINYLIARGLARYATDTDIQNFREKQKKQKEEMRKKKKILANVKGFIDSVLVKKPIKLQVKASSGGRVYASINDKMLIKEVLKAIPQLKLFNKDELYFEKSPKIEYVGKYALDLTIRVRSEGGKTEKYTLPVYIDVVSISKAKLKTHT